MPVFKSGKWGAVDTNLNMVVPYRYNDLKVVNDAFLCVSTGRKYGLIDKRQQVLLPFKYENIKSAIGGYLIITKKGLHGISKQDGTVLLDCGYKKISILNEDLAILETDEGHNFYRFSNEKMSPVYDKIKSYVDGLFLLEKGEKKVLYNYVLKTSSKVFSKIQKKRDNLFFCTTPTGEKYILKIKNGFDYIKTNRLAYFRITDGHYGYAVNGFIRIIDKSDNLVKTIKADDIYLMKNPYARRTMGSFFSNTYFIFEQNGKKGLLNEDYERMFPAKYDRIHANGDDLSVSIGFKKGVIKKDGSIILPIKYTGFSAEGDYWLVWDGTLCGIATAGGREIVKPKYQRIELAFDEKFIVKERFRQGVVNSSGNFIMRLDSQKITTIDRYFLVERDSLFGLASSSGGIIFSPKYHKLEKLACSYFAFTKDGKVGIVTSGGSEIIKAQFKKIAPTENCNLFFVHSFKSDYLSVRGLNEKFGLDMYVPKNDSKRKYDKIGVINIRGEKLLEPRYYKPQIAADFQGYTIVVKRESSVLVVSFEEDGEIIDKTSYKNYVFVKPGREIKPREGNYWEQGERRDDFHWGLFSARGKTILSYQFENIQKNFLNLSDLVKTTSPYGRYGIVNQRTGKVVLPDVYKRMYLSDLKKTNLIRCVKSNGKAVLIDSMANIIMKGISYMDDFSKPYVRVNKAGKQVFENNPSHKLYVNSEDNVKIKRKEDQEGRDIVCKKGKWGVIDLNANWTIEPKYQFIQSYANGVFIVQKGTKWGVVSPKDELLIDFVYDEVSYFKGEKSGQWAKIPFYKVRDKGKWGVIDLQGNLVVPIKYDDVSHLASKGKVFFKTLNDKGKILYGLVNQQGKLVLDCDFEELGHFKNGFAKVRPAKRCWKFINKQMQAIPTDCYVKAKDFSDGMAAVKTNKGWGFIDENGVQVIPCQYMDAGNFNQGLATAKIYIPPKFFGLIKGKRVYAIINKKGEVVYNTKSKKCSDVRNGHVVIKKGKKYQLITVEGKKVLPGAYDEIIENPGYQLYVVKDRGKGFALYNSNGKVLVHFGKYKSFSGFSEGLCFVAGQKQGYIDTTGSLKIEIRCKDGKSFHEGIAAVKFAKGWGYIDNTGKVLVKAKFRFAWDFNNGIAKVKDMEHNVFYINKRGQMLDLTKVGASSQEYKVIHQGVYKGIEDVNGQKIVYPAAKDIGLFYKDYAPVGIQKLYGLYSASGKQIVPTRYMIILQNKEGAIQIANLEEVRFIQ